MSARPYGFQWVPAEPTPADADAFAAWDREAAQQRDEWCAWPDPCEYRAQRGDLYCPEHKAEPSPYTEDESPIAVSFEFRPVVDDWSTPEDGT